MSFWSKVSAAAAGVFGAAAAVLAVLLGREKRKRLEGELRRTEAERDAAEQAAGAYSEGKRENEGAVMGVAGGSFDDSVALLHKLSGKRKRGD